MRPTQHRREQAATVVGLCEARAEGLYGVCLIADPTGRAAPGPSWEVAARDAGQRAARAASRAGQ